MPILGLFSFKCYGLLTVKYITKISRSAKFLQNKSMCLNTIMSSYLSLQVLETARQVASFPVTTTPIPYDQMKSQCEALVMGKHQKMSVLLSFKNRKANGLESLDSSTQNETTAHDISDMVWNWIFDQGLIYCHFLDFSTTWTFQTGT